jgi:uncharacterized protein (TIGR00106 family)
MIISQLSISPVGETVSLSKYVKVVLNVLRKNKIRYRTNDMATVIETENLDILFDVVKKAHNSVIESGAKRVITELKIDDRRDKNIKIGYKVKSVN